MKLIYISENKIYLCDNGKVRELPSERAAHYTNTVRSINQSKEWKHSGTGARFMGTAREPAYEENTSVLINGLALGENGLVYSVYLGGMGGIYGKSIEDPDAAEEHILTRMNTSIGAISLKNGRIAASVDGHLSVSDMKGNLDGVTDGDSIEDDPVWSETDGRIFCTTAGYARNEYGGVAAVSPRAVMAVDLTGGTMEELYADEKNDYLKPKNDAYGNFYYIRQPYKTSEPKAPLWKDILLFPVRIVKAIGGFLNAFSILFGGESLRSGRQRGDVKTKQKSDKELYFEGKLLEAEKNEKANAAKGEKNPGIFPVSRVLIKVSSGGEETVIKRGVLDYTVLEDGSIVCSNGRYLIHVKDGSEEVIAKARLAHSICVIG